MEKRYIYPMIVAIIGIILGAFFFPPVSAQSDHTPAAYRELLELLSFNPNTQKPIQDLEELLPLLPQELRTNFTFIYQSRGPHGGLGDESKSSVDKMFPRVVLFSNDAKLTLAFTSNPEKPGYNEIEIIHFEDATARFRMSRFVLPRAGGSPDNGRLDPPQCLRCHGSDPRPINDSYPLWPGFYGSVRDTFPKESPEGGFYRKFLSQQKGKGVFRHLLFPTGSAMTPYLDPKNYSPEKIEGDFAELKYLPNTRLGMAWTELNRKRIQRKLKSSPYYAKYRKGLLSGLLGCSKLPLSEENRVEMYGKIASENEDRLQRIGFRPKGPAKGELDMMELAMYENLTEIEYLAQVLKVSRADWAMAFEEESESYFDGILSSVHEGKSFYLKEDILLEMLRDLANEEPKYRQFFVTYSAYEQKGYPFGERLSLETALKACETLRAEKREDLPPYHPREKDIALIPTNAPAAARRCTVCHEGIFSLFTGRKIPFSDPLKMAEALELPSKSQRSMREEILERIVRVGEGQMPPHGDRLTGEEIKEMREYLKASGRE